MGERIGRIGRIDTDFFYFFTDSKHAHQPKNPFISARSAPSVLPSYHPFPNTIHKPLKINPFRNPQSTIRNQKDLVKAFCFSKSLTISLFSTFLTDSYLGSSCDMWWRLRLLVLISNKPTFTPALTLKPFKLFSGTLVPNVCANANR
jgi:hypothetical protein